MSESKVFDLDDQRRLNLSQNVREQIVNSMTEKGLPENEEDRNFLMKALDSMDRTTLTRARIKSDEVNGNTQQQMGTLVSELLKHITAKPPTGNVIEGTVELPILPSTVTVDNAVEGETVIGVSEVTYDAFVEKFET